MNNAIEVTFDSKTLRLVLSAPFHLNDAIRGLPSRRFDPKSKKWRVPLVAANIRAIQESQHLYTWIFDEPAEQAIKDHAKLSAAPKHVEFPTHVYDFKLSATKYDPMEHQHKMLNLSWGLPASGWFAKMGTGKTFSAVHLAFAHWIAGDIDAVMIICPSTLRRTWKKELAKYATREYDYRIHDTKAPWLRSFYAVPDPKDKLPILAVSVEGLGVSESLFNSAINYFAGRRVLCICDESSRIKNPKAKRTNRAIEMGAKATKRVILNGTPIALGIQDLWAQFEFLDPNIIGCGDYWAYKTRYIVMGGYEMKQIVGYQNVDELMKLIGPYVIEVSKDVLNLPPKIPKQFWCEPTAVQKALFRLIVKGPTGSPDEPLIKVENALEKMLRLRQVVGGYLPRAHVVKTIVDGLECEVMETVIEPLAENPKMDLLFTTIEGNYVGSKFIIWTTFVHEIEFIRDTLTKQYGAESIECYYGATNMDDRSAIEDRYCNDPTMRFFIGNPVAAGLGLTLISGESDIMLYYSGTSAFIDRAQSEDRAHRIGQENSVVVGDFIMEKTVDELIQASIAEKLGLEEFVYAQVAIHGGDKISAAQRKRLIDDMLLGD